ncbi:hypothetical protein Mal4_53310 [Maioricimonas rarisocia]|uniref:Uncharacterized protein n=1 Tax=Maioricimonas rarisocia TaxID=2528026 RepID=A0A517ZET0_9PLAN|nr:hypothetical protein Mal4_53310 [Maioricimonas rarisocia]
MVGRWDAWKARGATRVAKQRERLGFQRCGRAEAGPEEAANVLRQNLPWRYQDW